jgi:hypothetical protein
MVWSIALFPGQYPGERHLACLFAPLNIFERQNILVLSTIGRRVYKTLTRLFIYLISFPLHWEHSCARIWRPYIIAYVHPLASTSVKNQHS